MGSRISIPLVNLLGNPEVRVELRTLADQDAPTNLVHEAVIHWPNNHLEWVMNYSIHEGKIELESDCNLMRYTEEERLDFLGPLFQNSVSFNVIVG
jgi:hypothetical protein